MDNIVSEIIHSRKTIFLHINGYVYYKHSGVSRRYWNCRNKGQCSARAITTGDNNSLTICKGPDTSQHNHAPNREAVEAEKAIFCIKRKAAECPELTPAQILRNELREIPTGVLAEMPDRLCLRKQILRKRAENMPANSVCLSRLTEIPDQYSRTLSGSPFLIFDSMFADDDDDNEDNNCGRILIFATAENLKNLFKCDVWFVDGTFKTAPGLFFQLFSILGAVDQISENGKKQTIGLPFVHALLENKRQASYEKVFRVILKEGRKLGLSTIPNRVMCDFELAIINAAEEIFGYDKIKCCFFHLCQNVYRQVASKGLKGEYNSEDRELKQAIHMLCALAFVPSESVERNFQILREVLPEVLDPVVDYFESTYIRRLRVRRRSHPALTFFRRPPRYSPSLWNVYDAVLEGSARTNNLSEGWHNRFQVVVGKQHPSLYSFLKELQKEQGDTEIMLRQLQLGQRIRKGQEKRRKEIDQQIMNVVMKYNEYFQQNNILNYLKNVGYHIKF